MKYERRLYKLAVRQGRCPVHCAEPLFCVSCEVQWHGTPEEARELMGLFERLAACYEPDPPLRSYGKCPCGGPRFCAACNPWPPTGAHQYRDHGLTAGELDRFVALIGHYRMTNRGRGSHGLQTEAPATDG